MDEDDGKLTDIFNGLSKGGQRQLRVAALTNTIVDDAWADSVRHPWKFPLYALYIAGMVLPAPGTHTLVMAGLLIGWAKIGITREARKLSNEISAAQLPPALMKQFADCVGTDKDGAAVVKTGALFGNVLSNTWDGFKDASRQIFGGGPSDHRHNPT